MAKPNPNPDQDDCSYWEEMAFLPAAEEVGR